MAFVKIMIHAVWGTKNREPYLTEDIRPLVVSHIKENARSKGLFIDTVNGYTEHLHCLMGLNADMSISKAMHLIKGESAFWINKQKIIRGKFEWADEYFAVSVSESILCGGRSFPLPPCLTPMQHRVRAVFLLGTFFDTVVFSV